MKEGAVGGVGGESSAKSTATEHKSVEAETVAKGRALGLKGTGEQQLPDVAHQFGKSFEDPRTTAVGVMEPPPAQPGFAQSALDAKLRIDNALAQIGNMAQAENFQQWSDEQLERLIRLARIALQELEAREQKLQQAS